MLREITDRIEHFTEEVEYVKILKSDYDYLQEHIYKLETEESEREEKLQDELDEIYVKVDEIITSLMKRLDVKPSKLNETSDELTEKLIHMKNYLK